MFNSFSGGSEIRTHVRLASPTVFKTGPFNRSGIPPRAGKSGGGGIRTHVSLAAQEFSKLPQWTKLCDSSLKAFYTAPCGLYNGCIIAFYLQIVSPQTFLNPAIFKTFPTSFKVEPVVQTSSKTIKGKLKVESGR